MQFANRIASTLGITRFGFDSLTPKGRRRSVSSKINREDYYAKGNKHRALQANANDLARNLSLCGWMCRRHLDYVSQFSFHSRTGLKELDDRIEQLMQEDSRPARADVAGRFGREKLFRLAECRRLLDNDTFLIKLNDGRLQGVQADLVRDPPKTKLGEDWINGVRVNGVGRPLAYAVHKRKGYSQETYQRAVSARNVIHYGFFERYAADQVRGISPIVSALDPLRDVYDKLQLELARAKVSQLFAFAFFRGSEEEIADDEDETEGKSASYAEQVRQSNFGSGPAVLDLDPGDRAEFLESKQPSGETQAFTQQVVQIAIKALDIPFSFYDESHTNFFGSRAAWLHYERSCHDKREDQIEMRRNYTVWKLQQWIRDGRLVLPSGMTIADLGFEWVPRGMPWWDPSKEINGQLQAVKAGLDNPQRICRATGTDYFDNIDQIAKAREYAEQKGVSVEFALVDQNIVEVNNQ